MRTRRRRSAVSTASLVLKAFLLLLFTFPFTLVFLGFDAILCLHFPKTKRVRHQGFICGLLLFLDSEEWVLPDFGSNISGIVGILDGYEVLV